MQSRAISRSVKVALPVVLAALLWLPMHATAAWQPGDGAKIVRVDASAGGKTGHLQWVFTPGPPIDGEREWRLPPGQESRAIRSGPDVLATVEDLLLQIQTDPAVSVAFAVSAGAADTTFSITTASLAFAPISTPLAFASAGVTVTDQNSNGATLAGLHDGDTIYEARYNAGPAVAFANLMTTVTAVADSTNSDSDRSPATGRTAIGVAVNKIEAEFYFELTAGDSASGTSKFDVIPEPATAGLAVLAFGGLVMLRRRRR